MAAEITETVDGVVFDALKEGRLTFFTLPNAWVAQTGDMLTFRKKDAAFGGYVCEAGTTKPLTAKFVLGFAIPGGTLGIAPGRTGFQLEKID